MSVTLRKETNLYDTDAIADGIAGAISTYDESQNQTAIFNKLTNNGTAQGIFMEDGQLYINMSYLQTGTLRLGGAGNISGLMEVYNASGSLVARINNTGLYAISGVIAGWNIQSGFLVRESTITTGTATTQGQVYLAATDTISSSSAALVVRTRSYDGSSYGSWANKFLLTYGGAVTAKSFTADDYIYLNGINNTNNLIKMLLASSNSKYIEMSSTAGFHVHSSNSNATVESYMSNERYVGGSFTSSILDATGTAYSRSYTAIYGISGFDITCTNGSNTGSISLTTGTGGTTLGGAPALSFSASGTGIFSANYNGVYAKGYIRCDGTKSRVVETEDYGRRLLYCYETPSPLFGDVGEGVIAEDGKCYVMIDGIFSRTIVSNQYQIFLQKYGDGDCWVSTRKGAYFVVEGTPGLAFGWELKAKQSNFDQLRLEKESDALDFGNEIDYVGELAKHIEEITKEREVA